MIKGKGNKTIKTTTNKKKKFGERIEIGLITGAVPIMFAIKISG